MKALVCYGDGKMEFEDIPKPQVIPGHALIKVKATGICGTDRSIFAGEGPPWTKYPIVPGHEVSGTIEMISSDDRYFNIGDNVAVDNYLRCGLCWYCKNGHYFLCDHHAEVGMTINGGFAEYCLVPCTNLVPVPENVSVFDAVLTEPVANALRACRAARISFDSTVVVLGCGPLAVLVALVAKLMGAKVIIVGRGNRLKRIRNMDLDVIIDSSKQDWITEIHKATNQQKVDVVFDITGSSKLVCSAIGLLRKKGRVILMGVSKNNAEIPMMDIVLKEIELLGKVSGMGYFEEAINLMTTRRIDPSLVITHTYPLDNFFDALKAEQERFEGAIKISIVQD